MVADWCVPGLEPFPTGEPFALGAGTALAQVQTTGLPARADTYEGLEGAHPDALRQLGMHAWVGAPIVVDGELWGAVADGSANASFAEDAGEGLGAFVELVAQAIANVDARIKFKHSRTRLMEAADAARRGLERAISMTGRSSS